MTSGEERPGRGRKDYERGLPGYHDPTAGFGGSAPARSALSLRAVLAGFGLIACLLGAVLAFTVRVEWFGWLLVGIAVVAAIDLAWVLYRKSRGEPG